MSIKDKEKDKEIGKGLNQKNIFEDVGEIDLNFSSEVNSNLVAIRDSSTNDSLNKWNQENNPTVSVSEISKLERQRRRQELLKKQIEASKKRSQKEDLEKGRQKLYLKATQFLADPKVKDSSLEKKEEFLLSKGLTKLEIATVLAWLKSPTLTIDESEFVPSENSESENETTEPDLPPLPPRTLEFSYPIEIKPPRYPMFAIANSLLHTMFFPKPNLVFIWKQLAFLGICFSGISIVVTFLFQKLAVPVLMKVFKARCNSLDLRHSKLKELYHQIDQQKLACKDYGEDSTLSDAEVEESTKEGEKDGILSDSDSSKVNNSKLESGPRKQLNKEIVNQSLKVELDSISRKRAALVTATLTLVQELVRNVKINMDAIPTPNSAVRQWDRPDSPSAAIKSEIRLIKAALLRTTSKHNQKVNK